MAGKKTSKVSETRKDVQPGGPQIRQNGKLNLISVRSGPCGDLEKTRRRNLPPAVGEGIRDMVCRSCPLSLRRLQEVAKSPRHKGGNKHGLGFVV